MKLTNEQIDAIIPDLDSPITEDEYLTTLTLNNEGCDYGSVMEYDPEDAEQLSVFIAQMVSA